MDPGVEVRPAVATDDAGLARLDAAAWPPELQVVPPGPPDRPFFGERRRADDVLVAVAGDELLGYAHLARHIPVAKNAHVLHLNGLAVTAAARGRGVGAQLVQAVVVEARRRGARKLGLRAMSTNTRAVALYERLGFTLEGRLRDEFALDDGSYADDLWYALTL